MKPVHLYLSFLLLSASISQLLAHPGGNMIVVQDYVLWSYIDPLDDPNHHACVMIWRQGENPRVLLRSEHPASDYMFSTRGSNVYIVESRYLNANDRFEARILKMKIGAPPVEIWRWGHDPLRLGQAGFHMPADDEIVFASYPNVYRQMKGEDAEVFMDANEPIKRIRKVNDDHLLILGESSCQLITKDGQVVHEWVQLIDASVTDAPLNMNTIFDIDYKDDRLLLAYWGNRSFEQIDQKSNRSVIVQHLAPLTPHWVAYSDMGLLLFASELYFDGTNPQPYLLLVQPNGTEVVIWSR